MSQSPQLFDEASPRLQGLHLSNILWQDPKTLTPNPLNSAFEGIKDQSYLDKLKNDIARDGIVNALITTKSGLIIEGHSRLQVALALDLPLVPVRQILSDLSDQVLKERLYLGNLNRFEISKDMRTKMFADLYPHIFYEANATIPASLASAMGLSLAQVRNEKQLLLLALNLKEVKGDESPLSINDISQARKQINKQRREKERLKRMHWQSGEIRPAIKRGQDEAMPLFLSHEEESDPKITDDFDILQEYRLISQDSRNYAITTKNQQVIAILDPFTFKDLAQMDDFARDLILLFHKLRTSEVSD